MEKRYATIDIGTNTILMLIAEKDEKSGVKIIRDEHSLARLGEGIGLDNRKIVTEAKERAVKILQNYRRICDEMNVAEIFAVATSAMRDAENREEIKTEFSSILNSNIEIITGEQEAKFSFTGAVEDNRDSVVIDIGGGSTELIFGNISRINSRYSLQTGAVRLTEKYLSKHPPTVEDINNADRQIKEELLKISTVKHFDNVYAVAGTPTTLAGIILNLKEFDRQYIQGFKLNLSDIKKILKSFCKMSIEDIINIYHVNPSRADVITAGTIILVNVLEKIKSDYCIASTKGLRYGMMKYLLSK
ncbi:MAG: hypothetical protein V1779_12455 [bacterium]